jgi:hypothetical protein
MDYGVVVFSNSGKSIAYSSLIHKGFKFGGTLQQLLGGRLGIQFS